MRPDRTLRAELAPSRLADLLEVLQRRAAEHADARPLLPELAQAEVN
jgi:hypothetical protein